MLRLTLLILFLSACKSQSDGSATDPNYSNTKDAPLVTVEEDIENHLNVEKSDNRISITYQHEGKTINFLKFTGNDYFTLTNIETSKPGGFCSKYLPAFIKNHQVNEIVSKSSAVNMWVKTKASVQACRCYLKSFFYAGFRKMIVQGGSIKGNKQICPLPLNSVRIFSSAEEINDFCQDDPFRNKDFPGDEADCQLRIERSSIEDID